MKFQWNWGKGIAVVYILFVVGTLSFVTFAFTQKVELVSNDYYAQEIDYQNRIEQTERANALEEHIDISYDTNNNSVIIIFPSMALPEDGSVHFYHPSTSSFDRIIPIKKSMNNRFDFNTSGYQKGRWKVVVTWVSEGVKYYHEKMINL